MKIGASIEEIQVSVGVAKGVPLIHRIDKLFTTVVSYPDALYYFLQVIELI